MKLAFKYSTPRRSHPVEPVGVILWKSRSDLAQDPGAQSHATQLHSYLYLIIVSLCDNYFETGSCAKSLRDFHRMTPTGLCCDFES